MKVSVHNLKGAALNWAVAKCEGLINEAGKLTYGADLLHDIKTLECLKLRFQSSTNWSQGGPIIEREGITISQHSIGYGWFAVKRGSYSRKTPLIAAMRC